MESIGHRLVLDSGAYNFRFCRASEPTKIYQSLSRLVVDKKGSTPKVITENDLPINESELTVLKSYTKGILVNYVNFNELFEPVFQNLDISDRKSLKSHALVYSQRPFQPMRSYCNDFEFLFELEGYSAVLPVVTGKHIFSQSQRRSGVLIDVGHSHTYIVPVYNNSVVKNAVRRLEIGGNLLTKCLLEGASFTQLNIKKHYMMGNQMRESCFKVLPREEMNAIRKKLGSGWNQGVYVLPNFDERIKGRMVTNVAEADLTAPHIKITAFANLLPESLFNPGM